jgi:NAD(P)-dependent dehydrogenase (short-subunit alcohol dehydrogenase family)
MQVNLSENVALVTGAARNIGRAIADALAANGAQVIYTDIDLDEAEKAANAVDGAKALEMNVTDQRQVRAVIDQIVREYGRLDILVNNAGVMQNVQADQGLLVSWGGFKTSVDKEKASQFFRVRLWDQDDFINQLLAHYERLDDDLRAELPLKRIWTIAEADEDE